MNSLFLAVFGGEDWHDMLLVFGPSNAWYVVNSILAAGVCSAKVPWLFRWHRCMKIVPRYGAVTLCGFRAGCHPEPCATWHAVQGHCHMV